MAAHAVLQVQKLIQHFVAAGPAPSNHSNHSNPSEHSNDDEKEEEIKAEAVLYFGYGSNLSLQNFQAFKGINVISHFRATVPGWKLSFSLCYPTKAFANIHLSPEDAVHGIVMRLTPEDMDKLSGLELSYRSQMVTAYSYEEPTSPIQVHTFIFDKECEQRIAKEIENKSHIKQVTRFFDPNGGGKKPEKNYLNTIIRGAKEMGLDKEYIERLKHFESIPILQYQPTKEQLKAIHGRVWTMKELQQFKEENPTECVSVVKGIVFDMAKYPPSWKQKVNGKDLTLIYAARWAYAKPENSKSMTTLALGQKAYINGEVQKLLNGVYGAKIMGKVDAAKYIHGFDNYKF